jgi:hypothetical protein
MKCEDYLTARGISLQTVKEYRLEFDDAPDKGRIVDRLGDDILVAGRPLSQYAEELLWIPYLNAGGAISSWSARIFPTPPNGKEKFLTPKNGGGPVYIPPLVWADADNPAAPVIVTEGPIKALSCVQAGQLAIGVNGVFGFGGRDANDVIIIHPNLATFDWTKRPVFLAFDADLTSKYDVRKALFRTFLLAASQAADVYTITSWDVGDGKGIDDLLAKSEKPVEVLGLLIKDRSPVFLILEKTPADLRMVTEEFTAILLPRLQRTQIVRQVAKAVAVTAKDLLAAVTPPEANGANREVNLVDETTPWDGPVDGIELFREIYSLFGRVMWMSDSARLTITFWLIASYTFKAYRKFPYLRIKSADKNCGKSTLVDLVSELVFNPLIATDVSPAALYRVVEKFTPTLLLDEFDNAEQIRELTQLLNAGYDNNRAALRYNMDKDCAERFRTYCPKVISSIKRITDTTESRCLPIDLQRVPADAENKLVELCDINPEFFQIIKRKILAWLEDHLPEIKECRPIRPDWLHTRDWDMWRPCYVIGEVLGKEGTEWVKQAATGVFGDYVVEQSLAIEILAHLRDAAKEPHIFIEPKKGKIFLPSEGLVEFCNGDLEASWADWVKGDQKGLTVHRLAKELRQHFKVRSERTGYQNKDVRGYWLKKLEPYFTSFLPPEPPPEDVEKEHSNPGSKKGPQSGEYTKVLRNQPFPPPL